MSAPSLSVVAILPAFNEADGIERLIKCFPQGDVQRVVVVSDGSSDDTAQRARAAGAHVIEHARRMGCGPAIRTGLDFALEQNFDVALIVAGNGKDDPAQVERLLKPIRAQEADLVQGSRYLNGGRTANMPLHRTLGTRAYSFLFSVLCGRRITDATNGFRALRLAVLKDPRLNIRQDWLNNYEVESYIFYQAIRLGYRVQETPVSKIYPAGEGYTKMRPFSDWWSHFRPALLLRFGLRK